MDGEHLKVTEFCTALVELALALGKHFTAFLPLNITLTTFAAGTHPRTALASLFQSFAVVLTE